MDQLKGAQGLGRQRDLAPVLGTALERTDPDRTRVQADIGRPKRQDLAQSRPAVRYGQREGLVLGLRRSDRSPEEPLALLGREIFAAFRIDKLDHTLGHSCTITTSSNDRMPDSEAAGKAPGAPIRPRSGLECRRA